MISRGEMDLRTDAAKAYLLFVSTFISAYAIYFSLDNGNWIGGLIGFPLLTWFLGRKFWVVYTKKRTFREY